MQAAKHTRITKKSSHMCLFCERGRVGGGTDKEGLPLISLGSNHLCMPQLDYFDNETFWKQTREKREKREQEKKRKLPHCHFILLLLASAFIFCCESKYLRNRWNWISLFDDPKRNENFFILFSGLSLSEPC